MFKVKLAMKEMMKKTVVMIPQCSRHFSANPMNGENIAAESKNISLASIKR